jgi:hypothetical protein
MFEFIHLFKEICQFKKGPEKVPFSLLLFIILVLFNFIIETVLSYSISSLNLGVSALFSIISMLILFVFTWCCLMLFNLNYRLLQTITAFVGVNLLTNVIFLIPLSFLWGLNIISSESFDLLSFLLFLWIIVIYTYIYKNALVISTFLGFMLTITCFIIINTLSLNILGI